LVHGDDVNILGGRVQYYKNTEALVVGSKESSLEVNADKTKYMVMSRDKNAGRSHIIKIDNSSLESVEEFRKALKNKNSVQEEIKSRLKSVTTCYHSVRNLLSSNLLSKSLKTNIYSAILLPVVLYGCEAWSLTLREGPRLKMFEIRVLRRIFGPKRCGVTRKWGKLHNEELNDTYTSPNIVQVIKTRRMRWVGNVALMGERRDVYRILVRKPGGKRPPGRPRRRWEDKIKMDLQEVGNGGVRTGSS
jgi:hypothetical protein